MSFEEFFPIWGRLTAAEQQLLGAAVSRRSIDKGTLIYSSTADCIGLLLVREGRLRTFIRSEEGKEITLYRLFERDMCLFSASCMMPSLQFDVSVEAETDVKAWLIPVGAYRQLAESSPVVANYTNELIASHLSEVMWRMDQILFKRFDNRLADFLIEEGRIVQSDALPITHERIAAHLGTAREVVTRMLKYFQSEGMVSLSRGMVQITDPDRLRQLAK